MKARLPMLTAAILALTLTLAPCLVQGALGTGVLHAYTDAAGANEILPNPSGSPPYSIDILPGQVIWIEIKGITEFGPGPITVWIQFSPWVMTISTTVEGDGSTPLLPWTVGMFDDGDHTAEMEYCTTGVVFYGVQTNRYKAQNQFGTESGGHFHIVPEVPFGALAPLAAGICALALLKRKRL